LLRRTWPVQLRAARPDVIGGLESGTVAREHFNVLLNPCHPRFIEVTRSLEESLVFDGRLFRACAR
jgi:hypothetical protein